MTDATDAPDQRPPEEIRELLLDAILPHVPFDGWSEPAFRAALAESGVSPALARLACPRGAVDLALGFHARGDAAMLERLKTRDLQSLRFRDRIAAAVRLRLEAVAEHKEAVRRAAGLFALPQHVAAGTRAIWGTADLIWTALGDESDDVNWYTKRATLAGVYSGTLLYWLGDHSPGHAATWDFLDRRIDEVMQIEKLKKSAHENPLFRSVFAGPLWALSKLRAPAGHRDMDLPGMTRRPRPR